MSVAMMTSAICVWHLGPREVCAPCIRAAVALVDDDLDEAAPASNARPVRELLDGECTASDRAARWADYRPELLAFCCPDCGANFEILSGERFPPHTPPNEGA